MLEIARDENGQLTLAGRFDASQADSAQKAFDELESKESLHVVDFSGLDYISSAGLGVLLKTQKRLMVGGGGLRLVNVNNHIRDVFRYSGFDTVLEIEPAPGG